MSVSLRFQEIIFWGRRETIKNGLNLLIAVLASLVLLTLLADHFHLDQRCMAAFFDPQRGWHLGSDQPWFWLYQYGTLPGLVLGGFGLTGFYLSRTKAAWQGMQRHFLVIILTLIIGPGLLVNSFFKDYWGRPRPEQIQAFGGQWEYRPVFSPGMPGRGKSFPSGHCSMGFVFLTLAVFRKRSALLAGIGSFTGLVYGSLLGVARMAAGAHFPTDVLWSLGIIVMVITVLYYWVLRIPDFYHAPAHRAGLTDNGWLALKLAAIGLAVLLAFISRRPFFSSHSHALTLPHQVEELVVNANVDFEETHVFYLSGETPRIVINTSGFAYPKADLAIGARQEQSGRTLYLYHDIVRRGYHTDLNYCCEIYLPLSVENRLRLTMMEDDDLGQDH